MPSQLHAIFAMGEGIAKQVTTCLLTIGRYVKQAFAYLKQNGLLLKSEQNTFCSYLPVRLSDDLHGASRHKAAPGLASL